VLRRLTIGGTSEAMMETPFNGRIIKNDPVPQEDSEGFSPVFQRHDRVLIIAGGASLRAFNFDILSGDKNFRIITVNDSYFHIASDYWISIDLFWNNVLSTETRGKCYRFLGVDKLLDFPNIHYLKRPYVHPADKHLPVTNKDCLIETPWQIQTHNSCYAALNLAYHFRAKKIAILGLDADDGPHWYDDIRTELGTRGWAISFSKLPDLFDLASRQLTSLGVEVINGSPHSRVTSFPRVPPSNAVSWLED